jgi:hypothetical protein
MTTTTAEAVNQFAAILETLVKAWYASLADPISAQERVLHRFLKGYAQTKYGQQHHADQIETIADYRRAFPVRPYDDYVPILERVWAGEIDALLYEMPLGVALTRGTMAGASKLIPMTPDDIKDRTAAGRAVINYVLKNRAFNLLEGVTLNLAFPSVLRQMQIGDHTVDVGYSSGIYVKHVGARTMITTLPMQADIDALGGDTEVSAWHRRFELGYQQAKDRNVTIVGGVSNTMLQFGKWLKQTHGVRPRQLWDIKLMTLGSQAGINTRLAPAFKANYGRHVAVREIFGATEGMFGQQMDERRAWSPNYDLFFFEIEVGNQTKMLYEMRPGEIGSLVVSTVVFPRYKIRDLIVAFEPPYFRTIGRDQRWTRLRYTWEGILNGDLNRP